MFLEELQEKINSIKDEDVANLPDYKIKKDETVIAEATLFQRKLFQIATEYEKQARQLKSTVLMIDARLVAEEEDEEARAKKSETETHVLTLAYNTTMDKANLLRKLFWISVHNDFDHLTPVGSKGLTLVDNNQIASTTKGRDELSSFQDFLKKMLPPKYE